MDSFGNGSCKGGSGSAKGSSKRRSSIFHWPPSETPTEAPVTTPLGYSSNRLQTFLFPTRHGGRLGHSRKRANSNSMLARMPSPLAICAFVVVYLLLREAWKTHRRDRLAFLAEPDVEIRGGPGRETFTNVLSAVAPQSEEPLSSPPPPAFEVSELISPESYADFKDATRSMRERIASFISPEWVAADGSAAVGEGEDDPVGSCGAFEALDEVMSERQLRNMRVGKALRSAMQAQARTTATTAAAAAAAAAAASGSATGDEGRQEEDEEKGSEGQVQAQEQAEEPKDIDESEQEQGSVETQRRRLLQESEGQEEQGEGEQQQEQKQEPQQEQTQQKEEQQQQQPQQQQQEEEQEEEEEEEEPIPGRSDPLASSLSFSFHVGAVNLNADDVACAEAKMQAGAIHHLPYEPPGSNHSWTGLFPQWVYEDGSMWCPALPWPTWAGPGDGTVLWPRSKRNVRRVGRDRSRNKQDRPVEALVVRVPCAGLTAHNASWARNVTRQHLLLLAASAAAAQVRGG